MGGCELCRSGERGRKERGDDANEDVYRKLRERKRIESCGMKFNLGKL